MGKKPYQMSPYFPFIFLHLKMALKIVCELDGNNLLLGPEASSFWGKRPVFRASLLAQWGQRGPFCSKLGRTQTGRKEPACHPKDEWEVLEPVILCTPARICTHLLEKSHIGQAALGLGSLGLESKVESALNWKQCL